MINKEGAPGNNSDGRERQIREKNALSYARLAGIQLSPEAISLYATLRGDDNVLIDGDQRLLAEVLSRLGENEKLHKFKTAYPNIFH